MLETYVDEELQRVHSFSNSTLLVVQVSYHGSPVLFKTVIPGYQSPDSVRTRVVGERHRITSCVRISIKSQSHLAESREHRPSVCRGFRRPLFLRDHHWPTCFGYLPISPLASSYLCTLCLLYVPIIALQPLPPFHFLKTVF